jgi:hypothetical protein
MVEILPYQDGDSLPDDDHSSTEILEALVQRSLQPTGFLCMPRRYLWYETAHHSMLQLCLISTRMMRAPPLFPPMHSEIQTRQKPRRPGGKRRISRGWVTASGLNIDDRLRLIIKPKWSNMIANA